MFIDDYIEKIALQEELKNVKEQLKAAQEENTELKTALDWHRKDSLKACCDCSHKFGTHVKGVEAVIERLNEEKQQEGDNLRNRIKDLESEINQLKKNPSVASDAEWIAIHTADVETINKLDIQIHDLNNTITTLLDRLSKSTDENQELKKKVQELKDIIKDLDAKLYK